ncbi:uncharacterized protein BDW47DRAFT_3391 [Aspergillus candidus]|uniref:Uncharacterized protein n=1 Tax=Aspergillus candidus TaxID=41067 RepID=A0A2I2FPX4_ASPCN|nr:hypothetical protein BDW47DRAFT_3391 [Aspergillus candidus]PLB42675.1 hypothetical protein BDW47DRAFT_3391 [Aspergillus candidus]
MCWNTGATTGQVTRFACLCGLDLDLQEEGGVFHVLASCPPFTSCYVLLPTLYLCSAGFLFPIVTYYPYPSIFSTCVRYLLCTCFVLFFLLLILVNSPTRRLSFLDVTFLFFLFLYFPLRSLC